MQVQILYGSEIHSKEQLHQVLAERLSFPAYYGGNLDALYDCLTEWREKLELILLETESLREQLDGYGEKVLRVLEDAAAENPALRVKLY